MTALAHATEQQTDKHNWVPYVALAAGAGYLTKAVLVIVTDDGLQTVAAVLYLGSLVLALAAAIGQGLRSRRGRRTLVAVGLSVAVVAWVMGVGDTLSPLFEQFSDNTHLAVEGPLALLGLVLLGLGAWSRSTT